MANDVSVASLSGPQKAAVLMLSLPEEHAANVFELLDLDEIKEISHIISTLGNVDSNAVENLLTDKWPQGTLHRLLLHRRQRLAVRFRELVPVRCPLHVLRNQPLANVVGCPLAHALKLPRLRPKRGTNGASGAPDPRA